jgi:GMP synthase (glutamine-hydrolysing)
MMSSSSEKKNLDYFIVIDFGSQYTQLIARRVREAGSYCIVQPYTKTSPNNEPENLNATLTLKGIILSGGPNSAFTENSPTIPEWVIQYNLQHHTPILGICYGMQALATYFGGTVQATEKHEFGYAQVRAHGHTKLLQDIQDEINQQGHNLLDVWMSHGDQVTELPPSFKKMASSNNCPFAGMANEEKFIYALQFHPEVTHSKQGQAIIERFVNTICQAKGEWKMPQISNQTIRTIRQTIGQEKVILGLSGGVDSSVAAMLLHQAIGEQLHCVFIDNGLLRLNEAEQVKKTFKQELGINLHCVDASKKFMFALKDIADPEQKRKIIGQCFIEVFEEFAKKNLDACWLAQGTIYSDVIESAGEQSGKVIKSHHNVGGLPEKMNLKIIEPLRKLFKDEVRQLGTHLGIASALINRHPFPGPGLGVRILGEINNEKAEILRQADAIFIEELRRADWYNKVSQAFCVFLPIKSVGVVGDYRRYQWVIALRAVQTIDFMTAHWTHLPYQLLDTISNRIVNEITQISRVVYDISGKPPATIEWE